MMEISRDNTYTTGNLSDYKYFSKHYKMMTINFSQEKS